MKRRLPTYPISHDIPIPPLPPAPVGRRANGMVKVFPWAQMLPGDSFFIPENELPASGRASIHSAAARFRHQQGVPFNIHCRDVPGGLRVWRLELKERHKRPGKKPLT